MSSSTTPCTSTQKYHQECGSERARRGRSHRPKEHNDSGEIDVFEAERYFSEMSCINTSTARGSSNNSNTISSSVVGDHHNHHHEGAEGVWRSSGHGRHGNGMSTRRASLDIPNLMMSSRSNHHHHNLNYHSPIQYPSSSSSSRIGIVLKAHETSKIQVQHHQEKRYKQPSSPGGRLASFFHSLVNLQHKKNNKKKKPISSRKEGQEEEEEEISPSSTGWRRIRRSSFGYLTSSNNSTMTTTTTTTTTKTKTKTTIATTMAGMGKLANVGTSSIDPSAGHGLRSHNLINSAAATPETAKAYKELKGFSDHKQITAFLTSSRNYVKPQQQQQQVPTTLKSSDLQLDWMLDDKKYKFKLSNATTTAAAVALTTDNIKNNSKSRELINKNMFDNKDDDDDAEDGAESDSSSDLFELNLNNYNHHHRQS